MKKFLQIVLFVILAVLSVAAELHAAGTPAGTVIQSRSRVIFTTRSGGGVDTAYSAFVTIIVSQKAAVNVTPPVNAAATLSDSVTMDYPLTVTNSGNAVDGVKLGALSSRGFGVQIYRDANGDGILQNGERSLGTIQQLTGIPVDGQVPLVIRVSVPRGEQLNGVQDSTAVVAKSLFDSASFNTGRLITTVRTAGINPLNPGLTVSNAAPTAGDQVTYTFTLINSGSVPASGVTIYDLLPAGLSMISGSTTAGTFNGGSNPATWTIGTLAPSQSVTITLVVQVNSAVATGTVLTNSVGISYAVNTNNYTVGSQPVPLTVTGTRQYNVELTPFTAAQLKNAADTVWYRFKVRNSGSFKDVIELSATSSQKTGWTLYRDGNNNGSWDASDPLALNSNDSAGVDTDSLAAGDSLRVLAMAIMPQYNSGIELDSLSITASSAGDHTKRDTHSVVTTVRSPVIELNKTMLPAGNQPAGAVITYRISYANSGTLPISDFSVIDTAPKETEYIRNSIAVNGLAVSDNSGGITIATDSGNNTVITVSIGTLAANSSGFVEFMVKIK